ncbi:type 1 periplasmic binding fold superfamily protein [Aquimarina sp. 2201CG5-10]|uniref:type 1 periplasmic binding fold superfamily protein n=1 Tax=Aquimarina callyspongiae TaxID=3098150 RepID=UPI002AB411B2|nr:type 1 periplasmic binding fold superfamily protein [Aquimarina sp. 2201CG5-10]MDY8135129.1 type 1 periplasmic binding fold superfamily protein [Aquimarina sp. 2201CG5-10]
MNTRKFLSMLAIASLLMYSCSDDDDNPAPVNEEELITTMTITLTNGPQTVELKSVDLDGADGPNAPVITISGNLTANTTYTGSITLLNESETPAENIREEIEEEADEHQFFFEVAGGLNATATATDAEADYPPLTGTNPVGLAFSLVTTDASNGNLTVTLRHMPKKPNDGTLTDAGGDTDITQSFDLTIQ